MDQNVFVSQVDWRQRAAALPIDGRSFIAGRRCDARTGRTAEIVSPFNGKVIGKLAVCDRDDVDRAVVASRQAFPRWAALGAAQRKKAILDFVDLADAHAEELALLETLDTGKPIEQTMGFEIPNALATLRWYAEAADKIMGEIPPVPAGAVAMVTREPLGVVGAVVPWNFPLEIAIWKIAPALAAGNTVVLKPSE